jgi:CubicO group peptidase (beta-lactamase class C family)
MPFHSRIREGIHCTRTYSRTRGVRALRGGVGHSGLGRSIGFADPAARLGFADVMNRHAHKAFPSERFQPLVDATYQALGYTSKLGGKWS